MIGNVLGSMYSVGTLLDGARYWNDYYNNTHKFPKYFFRTTKEIGRSTVSTSISFRHLKRL